MQLGEARTVKRNHSTKYPNRYGFLAVRGERAACGNGQGLGFYAAAVSVWKRPKNGGDWSQLRKAMCATPTETWATLLEGAKNNGRYVIVTRQVGVALQLLDAWRELSARGWVFVQGNFTLNRAWCTWKNGNRTLLLCDLSARVDYGVRKLAMLCGVPMPDTPEWCVDPWTIEQRLVAECETYARAWFRVTGWEEANDCGMFRPTGAGQSWSALRHKWHRKGLVHHGEADLYDMERRAVWAGRCEAWRHGQLAGGPFTEWDMHLAYATIARDCHLPIRPIVRKDHYDPRRLTSVDGRFKVLADCRITTDVPVVPCERHGRIIWPVGAFTTTLWNPEIHLAVKMGARVECTNVVFYKAANFLNGWARWIIAACDDATGEADPVIRRMLKSWARTVIGRFGLSYRRYEPFGAHPREGFYTAKYASAATRQLRTILVVGNNSWIETAREEAPDSMPSVMGYIMSECRVRLWRAMHDAGFGHVVYCDTDGMLVDAIGSDRLRRRRDVALRPKNAYDRVSVFGPRQLLLDGDVKASGVPFMSRQTDGPRWEGESMSSPLGALSHRHPDLVRVSTLRGRLGAPDERRRHLPDGSTEPFRVAL